MRKTIKRKQTQIRNWYLRTFHDVGKTVHWTNRVDPSFTGYYTITTKRDENGYVGIYNEKKGHRGVPYFYLDDYRNF